LANSTSDISDPTAANTKANVPNSSATSLLQRGTTISGSLPRLSPFFVLPFSFDNLGLVFLGNAIYYNIDYNFRDLG
jgi:hypothetical protein